MARARTSKQSRLAVGLLVSLLSFCAAGIALAYSPIPITAVIKRPNACEMRFADRMSSKDLTETLAQRYGVVTGCVRVRGLVVNGLFFADADSYYRWAGQDTGSAIGLYTDEPKLKPDGSSLVRWVEIAGFAGSCSGLYMDSNYDRWEPPKGGYCDGSGGDFIIVKEARLGEPFKPTRLASDRDRARVGDLNLIPAFDIAPTDVQALARAWLAAVRTGDRQAYSALPPGGAAEPATMRALFDDPGMAWLRALPADTPIQLLSQTVDDRWTPFREPNVYIGCVCRDADCAGRWPIIFWDTGLNSSRPYACVSIVRPSYKATADWSVSNDLDPRQMREPSRAAGR